MCSLLFHTFLFLSLRRQTTLLSQDLVLYYLNHAGPAQLLLMSLQARK